VFPVASGETIAFGRVLLTGSRNIVALFGQDNPTQLGSSTIDFLRREVPPRSRLAVDPLGSAMIGIFAPIYGVPIVQAQVTFDGPQIDAARQDRHPLFNSRARAGLFNHDLMVEYLDRFGIDYILWSASYRDALARLVQTWPSEFRIVFTDSTTGDSIVRYCRP
jgi:hypothetical protein